VPQLCDILVGEVSFVDPLQPGEQSAIITAHHAICPAFGRDGASLTLCLPSANNEGVLQLFLPIYSDKSMVSPVGIEPTTT
jgi:hypothetical protein